MATPKRSAKTSSRRPTKTPPASRRRASSANAPFTAPKGWKAIASLVLGPDGSSYAGRSGTAGVVAWNPDGSVAWTRDLPFEGSDLEVAVQLVDDTLFAYVERGTHLWLLDPVNGDLRRTIGMVPLTQRAAVAPDGRSLFMRTPTDVYVFALPVLQHRATFEGSGNQAPIVFSPDGRHAAVSSPEPNVIDLVEVASLKPSRSVSLPDDPYVLAFAPDGALATGGDASRVGLYGNGGVPLFQIDAAPERVTRKPAITAIVASVRHVAAGREDGVVLLLDRQGQIVQRFEGHQHRRVDATGIAGLAFSPDGTRLWVTAALRQAPVGLSVYPVT